MHRNRLCCMYSSCIISDTVTGGCFMYNLREIRKLHTAKRQTEAKQVRSAWKGWLVSYDRRFHSCTRVACASVLVLKVGWLVNYNRKFHNPRASFLLQKTLDQPTTTACLTSLLEPSLQCPVGSSLQLMSTTVLSNFAAYV